MQQDSKSTIEKCDIFDFMAEHVGLSILHPGGFAATAALVENCHIVRDTKIIDIACGKGTTALYLAEKYNCEVVGVDISKDLIDHAKKLTVKKRLTRRVSFQVGDALILPFEDNEFDIAVSQAMLILVGDKKKAIQEAMRVVKPEGHAGWIELSWRQKPTEEFFHKISNEIFAYCMTNVHTYDGWKEQFTGAGVKQLEILQYPMDFRGPSGMVCDEGFWKSFNVMMKCMTNSKIRKRMKTLDKFFKTNPQYFGYGIYIARKQQRGENK